MAYSATVTFRGCPSKVAAGILFIKLFINNDLRKELIPPVALAEFRETCEGCI